MNAAVVDLDQPKKSQWIGPKMARGPAGWELGRPKNKLKYIKHQPALSATYHHVVTCKTRTTTRGGK